MTQLNNPVTNQPHQSQQLIDQQGIPLRDKLRKAEKSRRIRAFMLVLPLLAFILITFIIPIAEMLFRSVDNPAFIENVPAATQVFQRWNGSTIPDEQAFAIIAADMRTAFIERRLGKVANRLNQTVSGGKSFLMKTGRMLRKTSEGPFKEIFIKKDKRWNDPAMWWKLKVASQPYTGLNYLNAIDKTYSDTGKIVNQSENRQIYLKLFMRTLWVSLMITLICILLAYPIAYLMAILPTRTSNLLMILVLLPFWTSLLVRTTSWIVLLQTQGILNDLMVFFGFILDETRLQMIYNMTGTVIAMTHILLPFMVLPLYSVMKTISPTYMRAAKSLGARPSVAFFKIYFPLTIPGIGAGSILVFILAIGYYITPALVGGQSGQLISNFIAFHMQKSLNWGLAAALGAILLAGVVILYWVYDRVIGITNMKFG